MVNNETHIWHQTKVLLDVSFSQDWVRQIQHVANFFHIHIGWELMKGEVPVEIVYEPKDEPRKEF